MDSSYLNLSLHDRTGEAISVPIYDYANSRPNSPIMKEEANIAHISLPSSTITTSTSTSTSALTSSSVNEEMNSHPDSSIIFHPCEPPFLHSRPSSNMSTPLTSPRSSLSSAFSLTTPIYVGVGNTSLTMAEQYGSLHMTSAHASSSSSSSSSSASLPLVTNSCFQLLITPPMTPFTSQLTSTSISQQPSPTSSSEIAFLIDDSTSFMTSKLTDEKTSTFDDGVMKDSGHWMSALKIPTANGGVHHDQPNRAAFNFSHFGGREMTFLQRSNLMLPPSGPNSRQSSNVTSHSGMLPKDGNGLMSMSGSHSLFALNSDGSNIGISSNNSTLKMDGMSLDNSHLLSISGGTGPGTGSSTPNLFPLSSRASSGVGSDWARNSMDLESSTAIFDLFPPISEQRTNTAYGQMVFAACNIPSATASSSSIAPIPTSYHHQQAVASPTMVHMALSSSCSTPSIESGSRTPMSVSGTSASTPGLFGSHSTTSASTSSSSSSSSGGTASSSSLDLQKKLEALYFQQNPSLLPAVPASVISHSPLQPSSYLPDAALVRQAAAIASGNVHDLHIDTLQSHPTPSSVTPPRTRPIRTKRANSLVSSSSFEPDELTSHEEDHNQYEEDHEEEYDGDDSSHTIKCEPAETDGNSSSTPRRRRRRPNGEPFVCEICFKTFTQKGGLQNHCLAVGTRLRQYDGPPLNVEDVTLSTLLVGIHGRSVQVTHVEAGTSSSMYRVVHRDGTNFTCTPQHRLTLMWNRDFEIINQDEVVRIYIWDGQRPIEQLIPTETILGEKHAELVSSSFSSPLSSSSALVSMSLSSVVSRRSSLSISSLTELIRSKLDVIYPRHRSSVDDELLPPSRLDFGAIFEMTAEQLFKHQSMLLHGCTEMTGENNLSAPYSPRASPLVVGYRESVPTSPSSLIESPQAPSLQFRSSTDFIFTAMQSSLELSNSISIASIEHISQSHRIMSIEVDGDHRYQLADGTLTHNSRIHRNERPFVCKVEGCMRAFAQKCNLTRHARCHTGEKPFECDQCDRRFNRRWGLVTHQRSFHGVPIPNSSTTSLNTTSSPPSTTRSRTVNTMRTKSLTPSNTSIPMVAAVTSSPSPSSSTSVSSSSPNTRAGTRRRVVQVASPLLPTPSSPPPLLNHRSYLRPMPIPLMNTPIPIGQPLLVHPSVKSSSYTFRHARYQHHGSHHHPQPQEQPLATFTLASPTSLSPTSSSSFSFAPSTHFVSQSQPYHSSSHSSPRQPMSTLTQRSTLPPTNSTSSYSSATIDGPTPAPATLNPNRTPRTRMGGGASMNSIATPAMEGQQRVNVKREPMEV